jgi:U3 small nucleolar RNA-associated protein 19
VYDVLSRTPPAFEDYRKKTRGKTENDRRDADDDGEEDFEAALGLMKGDEKVGEEDADIDARGTGDHDHDHDDESMTSAWCKALSVGEKAAADVAAASRRGKKMKKSAVTVAAEAKRAASFSVRDKWSSGTSHRKQFQNAWLSVLRKPFPSDVYRKVLLRLHKNVVPHMPNPSLLSDFFVRSIDRGGLDGMLALNGLFTLMTQHGLEYPKFYDRLYTLLDPSALHVSNRKGFFELLDIFLKSTALPGYLAAAFVKRLARLALTAPPAGAMTCIAFVHNLLRRHPGCSVLVHRGGAGGGGGADAGQAVFFESDPFLENERDPSKCKALESSLWEMATLRDFHYYPQVSKLAETLDKDLENRVKTAELPVSDICAANYASLLQEEFAARVKTAPVAYHRGGVRGLFQTPLMKQFFSEKNFEWKQGA